MRRLVYASCPIIDFGNAAACTLKGAIDTEKVFHMTHPCLRRLVSVVVVDVGARSKSEVKKRAHG